MNRGFQSLLRDAIYKKNIGLDSLIRALELNQYHKPAGPGGGQFTSAGAGFGLSDNTFKTLQPLVKDMLEKRQAHKLMVDDLFAKLPDRYSSPKAAVMHDELKKFIQTKADTDRFGGDLFWHLDSKMRKVFGVED